MIGETCGCRWRADESVCGEWVAAEGVDRKAGWKLGVLSARTLTVFLLSALLHMGQSQRDTEYLNHNTDLPPHFLETPVHVSVREGSMAVLPCAVQYLGPTQVAWRRVGAEDKHFLTLGTYVWLRGSNLLVEHHQEPGYVSHWNLLIKDVAKDQAGVYECQITAKEKLVRYVTLEVTGPPITEPGKVFVNLGDPIHLTCNATGGPQIPEDIDWFKDGSKIDTRRQTHVMITKFRLLEQQALISELIINRSQEKDKGTYICRSSEEKIDSLIVNILVSEKPNVEKRDNQETTSEEQAGGRSSASHLCVLARRLTLLWVLLTAASLLT